MDKPKTLAAKLCAIMSECKNIPKNGKNSFQNYKYVMAADAAEYIRDLMVKHGVIALPMIEAVQQDTFKTQKGADNFLVRVVINYTFINADDPQDTYQVKMAGTGSDTSDKAIFKAITGCQKYFLMNSFCLGGDDDPEKEEKAYSNPKSVSKAQSNNQAAPKAWTGEAIIKGGPEDGKKWKEANPDWLESMRYKASAEAKKLIELELNRRDEEAFDRDMQPGARV